MESTARAFACGILSMLKSKSAANAYIEVEHNCWRYVTQGKGKSSEHRGYELFERNDLSRLSMHPSDWWYFLNEHGEGKKVDFPLKVKAVVIWSPKNIFLMERRLWKDPDFQ